MIQIDPEEDILKVLDIDASQVRHIQYGLWNRLAGFETYRDKPGGYPEHMYPVMILENMQEADCAPQEDVETVLKEIRELCDKYDCSYFRIINQPIG